MEKLHMTLWDKNNENLNKMRAKLILANKNIKRATLINMLLEICLSDHPDFMEEPSKALDLHEELKE